MNFKQVFHQKLNAADTNSKQVLVNTPLKPQTTSKKIPGQSERIRIVKDKENKECF
ncbi:MAG: hypothetical protein CM15mP130_2560 [Verrucomicrobiota bacterium]|nr:MAG: hypothetical protein CM15mP130_2560 [Verrucomicrobiota bacterium]